jgi:Sec-independent protein translocase protein TatA
MFGRIELPTLLLIFVVALIVFGPNGWWPRGPFSNR